MKSLITAILLIGVSLSQAQTAQRTFVSAATGNDANPCSRAAPCRQFSAAIAKTSAGGEVIVLDSGGYGPVTISQAVALISPPGVYAGITEFAATAVNVNAGASDVVVLRGLTINGLGGDVGVFFGAGMVLHLENLVISGFLEKGIESSAAGEIFVGDTIVRNNSEGMIIGSSLGTTTAVIDRARFEANSFVGLRPGGNTRMTIRDSVFARNGGAAVGIELITDNAEVVLERCSASQNGSGFTASSSAGPAILNVSNSVVAGNAGSGISASDGATVRISGNTITRNVTGLHQFGTGVLESAGNNSVRGNTNETSGTITTFAPM